MISKAQKIRAGIFFIITTLLLVSFILLIIGNTLFKKRDIYFITYNNVSVNGLQLGSSVKYYGINIGRVENIRFNKDDVNKVIVEISINAGTPIKEDVEATLVGVGITGLKQIEIVGGSNAAVLLEPGSEIKAGKDAISDITGKAEVIAEKTEMLINRLNDLVNDDNRLKIANIVNSSDTILAEFKQVMTENRPKLNRIFTNLDTLSLRLKNMSENLDATILAVRNIVTSVEIENILANTEAVSDSLKNSRFKSLINQDLIASLENLNVALERFNDAVNHIDLTVLKGREDFLKILEEMEESAEYLKEFSRRINEDPSSLIRQRK
ncbi:MAG: MCE family protein [Candidatus Marinimicrobia bacterium]|nr:MCE family protein [Candidatus Neomarinimicrobiota bacterium]